MRHAVEAHFVVQVRTCGSTGVADLSDDRAALDLAPDLHVVLVQVGVDGREPLAVVDLAALPGARFQLAERAYGRFQRIVEVPAAVNTKRMEARLDSGLLRISIPKVDDRRGQWRRVPVSVESRS